MRQSLSVDLRGDLGRARVTVTGALTHHGWVLLLRTLEAAAAMYSDITLDLSRVTRVDAAVLADLAGARAWLAARDGRFDVVRTAPLRARGRPAHAPLGASGGTALGRPHPGTTTGGEEARALALVTTRLQDRFPTIGHQVIHQLVAGCHREFDGTRIRDFVPILVERQARDHLRVTSEQRRGSLVQRPPA